jgi:hypothetical protein
MYYTTTYVPGSPDVVLAVRRQHSISPRAHDRDQPEIRNEVERKCCEIIVYSVTFKFVHHFNG